MIGDVNGSVLNNDLERTIIIIGGPVQQLFVPTRSRRSRPPRMNSE